MLLLRDTQRGRVGIREQTWRCLWSSGDSGPHSISCIRPLGRYCSFTPRKLQNSSWTLKLETLASRACPAAHAPPRTPTHTARGCLRGHKFCLSLLAGEERRACRMQSPPAVADLHCNPRLQGQKIFSYPMVTVRVGPRIY